MKMTKDQAIAYCTNRALSALDGTPQGEHQSILWTAIRQQIEQQGLQEAEEACVLWRDHHVDGMSQPGNTTWTLYGTFLDALYDDEEVERAIAGELLWKVKEEIDRREEWPLRTYYLSCFRNHLNNVLSGSANLSDYDQVREGIELHLHTLEEEYGKWVKDALEAQD